MKNMVKFTLLFLLVPGMAYAYVDPGVIGMLLQGIFVVVFGFFLGIILKPFQKIKSFFAKKKNAKLAK